MAANRIKAILAKKKISASALAARIPGMSKVGMSFIVNGHAMPTREHVRAITNELGCLATDIWDESELDLNCSEPTAQQIADCLPNADGYDADDGLRPEEESALATAIKGLGYRGTSEWIREMYRQTIRQYAALEGVHFHDVIPPYDGNFFQTTH